MSSSRTASSPARKLVGELEQLEPVAARRSRARMRKGSSSSIDCGTILLPAARHPLAGFSTLRHPMASLDSLPADQRAVLQLVLQRGRSYDEIAQLLSIDRAAVRERALSALDALGPQTGVPPERRALITDYLLGQLPPRVAEDTRDRLARSRRRAGLGAGGGLRAGAAGQRAAAGDPQPRRRAEPPARRRRRVAPPRGRPRAPDAARAAPRRAAPGGPSRARRPGAPGSPGGPSDRRRTRPAHAAAARSCSPRSRCWPCHRGRDRGRAQLRRLERAPRAPLRPASRPRRSHRRRAAHRHHHARPPAPRPPSRSPRSTWPRRPARQGRGRRRSSSSRAPPPGW